MGDDWPHPVEIHCMRHATKEEFCSLYSAALLVSTNKIPGEACAASNYGSLEKEELQRQIYLAAYETYALDRVRDQV